MITNPTPPLPAHRAAGAQMGRGWPHIADYAPLVVAMYAAAPPRDANERRHLAVAEAALSPAARPKVSLQRIRIDRGGYDSGGAYWGTGLPLYCAASACGTVDLWLRARDREEARQKVRAQFPQAKFFR